MKNVIAIQYPFQFDAERDNFDHRSTTYISSVYV